MSDTVFCPICRSAQPRFLFEGWDNYYGHPDPSRLYRCGDCGHLFVAGELTPEQLTDMYTNYYPRAAYNTDDYEPYKEKSGFLYWLDGEEGFAFRHVPENVPPEKLRVLDIGCGFCEPLGYHKNRGCEVYGVEADENAKKIADRYGFNIEIGLFDPKKYEPNFFDYVTMDQVLEHVVAPLKTLQEINSVLKPGGRFIASVPNISALGKYFFGSRWLCWHFPYHRHFFTRKSFSLLAEQSGFVIETMRSATLSKFLLDNWAFIFVGGSKGKKAAPVFQTLARFDAQSRKRWEAVLYSLLAKTRLLSPAMRLADLFGIGCWNLVILRKD
jgi:SAM-dependent methyltransferase